MYTLAVGVGAAGTYLLTFLLAQDTTNPAGIQEAGAEVASIEAVTKSRRQRVDLVVAMVPTESHKGVCNT